MSGSMNIFGRENIYNAVHTLNDLMGKISYKPGWKIYIRENQHFTGFDVTCVYEGYDSQDAYFDPIRVEDYVVSSARERLAMSIGKSVRQRNRFTFTRHFDPFTLETMTPDVMIRYVIGDTLKQAEMYEFERWFKYDGAPVFERDMQDRERASSGYQWPMMRR